MMRYTALGLLLLLAWMPVRAQEKKRVPPPRFGTQMQLILRENREVKERLESFGELQQQIVIKDESEEQAFIQIDSSETSKPVHGYDSRFEIMSLTLVSEENQHVVTNSFSVLGIVNLRQLRKTGDGFEISQASTLQECFQLCPDQPYIEQPVLCSGTAFLVSRNTVLTARHNLDVVPFGNMTFLAGYHLEVETGRAKTKFAAKDVFKAKAIIRSTVLDGFDLVLIRLDRDIEAAIALPIEPQFKAAFREPVYALGYPVGLPMKYITNASISQVEGDYNFYTTLDTFSGNSGSPVFSRKTHGVVGVLVEGGIDFKLNGQCNVSNVCAHNCLGERVVNISALRDHILRLANHKP